VCHDHHLQQQQQLEK
jgi:hypothetical protein